VVRQPGPRPVLARFLKLRRAIPPLPEFSLGGEEGVGGQIHSQIADRFDQGFGESNALQLVFRIAVARVRKNSTDGAALCAVARRWRELHGIPGIRALDARKLIAINPLRPVRRQRLPTRADTNHDRAEIRHRLHLIATARRPPSTNRPGTAALMAERLPGQSGSSNCSTSPLQSGLGAFGSVSGRRR